MPRCVMSGLSAILFIGLQLASTPLVAEPLSTPTGEVILTISGNIERTNAGAQAHLDRDMLMALESCVIETSTPWHREPGRFEGPLFRAILSAVGARGEVVHVQALDGFEAEIPVSDLETYDVILAMKHNGETMAIRDMGPLFVLYPFDDYPELLTEMIRFRSVWQVNHLHVP